MMEKLALELKSIFNIWFIALAIGIGLYTALSDSPMLMKEKLFREAKIARGIGATYVLIGLVIYIVFRMI